EQLAGGLGILRDITPRTIDYVVARGERLSAQLFAAALEAVDCPAVYVDATDVVRTDGTFGNASPDVAATARSARRTLGPVPARASCRRAICAKRRSSPITAPRCSTREPSSR